MEDLPLSVLFLWHQHQPLYKDSLTQRYELPWVRLHATKDYLDMAALLDEFPSIKSNFNLVPSLLIQLDDYAEGKAQDKFLELTLKRAADLSSEECEFILQNFFMANWEHMVDPYPRYRELLDKRGRSANKEGIVRAIKYFKEQDWRDLQLWFNLAWLDPLWRQRDAFVNALFNKGKNFTEDDKLKLVDIQRRICGQIVSKHKELQDRGQIDITTTPFYHPILPLLCDTESARIALPHTLLPRQRFQHPEDAREQVRRSIDDYTRRFGHPPQGMWPAEGSVSEEAARLFAEAGIRWVATDEAVLAHSIAPSPFSRQDIYEPYKLMAGDKPLHFFFRDHELSDAIGFVYASWDPEEAAKDFIKKLKNIQSNIKDKTKPHVVSVILDGENCWEYYHEDGLPFLRALYSKLSADASIQTVRASEYLDRVTEIKTLSKLWTGSWINANFAIWIGHSEDNRAWDLLSRTRLFLQNTLQMRPEMKDTSAAKQAWEEIYIAEGSDWCWWYGEDHSSGNDEMFDFLFRKHLMNVYSLLGEKIPEDLHFPIKKKRAKTEITEPVDFITPTLDGIVTNYFEWQSAGLYHTEAGATGTMHKSENFIKTIYYGFDSDHLYFRLDPSKPLNAAGLNTVSLKLIFYKPDGLEISMQFDEKNTLQLTSNQLQKSQNIQKLSTGAYRKIIEFGIPINLLENPEKLPFEVVLIVQREGLEQERWPVDSTLHIPYPTENVFVENWHI